VYQAGTLSGNPVAVAAGIATLRAVQVPGFFDALERVTTALVERLSAAAHSAGIAFSAQSVGGMFGIYFRDRPPSSYAEVMQCDVGRFSRFFHAMLSDGVYLAPSAFEAGFVSAAHGDAEIEHTVQAATRAFRDIAAQPA
jgi:glutamate-1-semialdehyde 2,1-aminomutase